MTNTVRFAAEGDIPAIMRLLEQVNRVHYEGRPDLFRLATKYTNDELLAIINNEDTPVFVCTDEDGHVLGHGFCVMQRPLFHFCTKRAWRDCRVKWDFSRSKP